MKRNILFIIILILIFSTIFILNMKGINEKKPETEKPKISEKNTEKPKISEKNTEKTKIKVKFS
jgi:hypothetical protein